MLSVLAIWLLMQLPVGFALGRILACPQRQPVRRTEARPSPIPTTSRAA